MAHFVNDRSPTTVAPASAMPGWKRAIDIGWCLVAMPFLIACTVVMTIITKLVSPGPVLFRQERVGFRGKRFKIYKFRSMHVNVDTKRHETHFGDLVGTNAPMVKLDSQGGGSLIPGGWLLRASGLDELPQIINILKGEMSLIGPRPCLPAEEKHYQTWQRERFNSVPGLTGLWQVSGKNQTTFDQMIRLDIRYAQTISPWLDLKIMALTPPTLVRQVVSSKMGRKTPVLTAHTAAPFVMTRNRAPIESP